MMREPEINSAAIMGKAEFHAAFNKHFKGYTVVVSAPGQIIITGEKVLKYGPPGISQLIPRRTYVGIRTRKDNQIKLDVGGSIIFEESTCSKNLFPTGPKMYEPQGHDKSLPLLFRHLGEVLDFHFKKKIETGFDVRIWTEWKTETGLGWSGSFAAALAVAVLVQNGVIKTNSQFWRRPDFLNPHFQRAVRLGWIIEAFLHGGRSTGMAVSVPLCGSELPIEYRAPNLPRLWELGVEPGSDTSLEHFLESPEIRSKRYKEYFDYPSENWKCKRLVDHFVREDFDEKDIAGILLKNHHILVIHTNEEKNTAETSKAEQIRIEEDKHNKCPVLPGLYQSLRAVFCKNARDMKALLAEASDLSTGEAALDSRWQAVIDNVATAGYILEALGFRFPVADEILGALRSEISRTQENETGNGKTTGAGTGGNLIFILRARGDKPHNKPYEIVNRVRDRHTETSINPQERSSISIMYDSSIDGREASGVKLEEIPVMDPDDDLQMVEIMRRKHLSDR